MQATLAVLELSQYTRYLIKRFVRQPDTIDFCYLSGTFCVGT